MARNGRRAFLAGGCAALLASRTVVAQGRSRLPTIGILIPDQPDPDALLAVFRLRLAEIGYVVGSTIHLEVRKLPADPARLLAAARELAAMEVDVIAAFQTPAVIAARQATSTIPIIMAGVANPVETGLVDSLARPGGNITGFAGVGAELAAKSVELLPEALPNVRRLGVLANAVDKFTPVMLAETDRAARAVGIETMTIRLRPEDDVRSAFASFAADGMQALYVQPSIATRSVVALALEHRLPSISFIRAFVVSGGLFAYASDLADMYRQVAGYIDQVLRGARPAVLPVAQSRRFVLVINLQTAKALGITFPPAVLLRADEVIE